MIVFPPFESMVPKLRQFFKYLFMAYSQIQIGYKCWYQISQSIKFMSQLQLNSNMQSFMNSDIAFDFPSQIHDSFQFKGQFQSFNENNCGLPNSQQPLNWQGQCEDSYINQFMQNHSQYQNSNKDDSFLDLIQNHIKNNDQQRTGSQYQQEKLDLQKNTIRLSRNQVILTLLENQQAKESIQITNFKASPVKLKIISNLFKVTVSKLSLFKNHAFEIMLNEWQKLTVQIQIQKDKQQFGDLIQTIIIHAFQNEKLICQQFLQIKVKFVRPPIQITFNGFDSILRVSQTKIGRFTLKQNQKQTYQVGLKYYCEGIQKMELKIQTKGYFKVFPQKIILHNGEQKKVKLSIKNEVGGCRKSILILKPLNSSLNYVSLLTID